MDISAALEREHSKTLTLKIVRYVGEDSKRFRELMRIFLESDYRITQRAAWAVGDLAVSRPELFRPYYKLLVKKLQEPGHHPAVPRNILRIFQDADIPEEFCGELLDICFGFIRSGFVPVAVRAFAITVSANICGKYPEIQNELKLILQELAQLPQPPAIRHRMKTALKAMESAGSKN
jgi:hypothetical protein